MTITINRIKSIRDIDTDTEEGILLRQALLQLSITKEFSAFDPDSILSLLIADAEILETFLNAHHNAF